MRIHSDILTNRHLIDAAAVARVDFDQWEDKGSRKRDHAFDVTLTGESRRRPNRGTSADRNHRGYAATWDQWGVFLAALFAIDPNMVTPYYADAEDFAFRTADRFGAPETEMSAAGYADVFKAYGWPADAHGDHRFDYAGTPRQFECKKCTAVQRHYSIASVSA